MYQFWHQWHNRPTFRCRNRGRDETSKFKACIFKASLKAYDWNETIDEIKAYDWNEKTMYAITSALSKLELFKVISLKNTYEVCKKLKKIYEGYDKVKFFKQLTTKRHYENHRMDDDDGIKSHFQRAKSVVNEIKNQGDNV